MISKEIRSRLLHGATIDTICHDYNITFKQLITKMSRLGREKKPAPSKTHTGQIYIVTNRSGRYIVRKKGKYYGSYRSLNDAVKVRDYFLRNGWNVNKVDKACKTVGVERCTH